MGTHISKVKSVNMDKWDIEMVDFIGLMGNGRAEGIYRASAPSYWQRPREHTEQRELEKSIRDTHEMKRYRQIEQINQDARDGKKPGAVAVKVAQISGVTGLTDAEAAMLLARVGGD
eukprot:gene37392-65707_t